MEREPLEGKHDPQARLQATRRERTRQWCTCKKSRIDEEARGLSVCFGSGVHVPRKVGGEGQPDKTGGELETVNTQFKVNIPRSLKKEDIIEERKN